MSEHQHIRCVLCSGDPEKRRQATIGQVCVRDRGRLDERLADIPRLYKPLASMLAPSAGGEKSEGKRGKAAAAPLPLRVDILNLITRSNPADSSTERRDGPLPTLEVLLSWERMTRDTFAFSPPTGAQLVPGVAMFLRTHLDAICTCDWVVDFAYEVRDAHNALRDAHGEHRPRPIGTCPALVDRGGVLSPCGTALYASTYSDRVRCSSCHETWDRDRWKWLGQTMGVIAS